MPPCPTAPGPCAVVGPDSALTAFALPGAALGANPWPLVLPCHRVVAARAK